MAWLAGAGSGAAHPHVWVTVDSAFRLDAETRLAAITQTWTYDAMYSSYAVFGLDRDGDGAYSPAELSGLLESLEASLRERGHFTRATIGEATLGLAAPTAETLAVDAEGRLVLTFTTPLAAPAPLKGRELSLVVRDVEYFVDFSFARDRAPRIDPPSQGCVAEVKDDQPPHGADPEALMKSLIEGPIQTLGSSVLLRCGGS